MSLDLFQPEPSLERLPLEGADVQLIPNFLSSGEIEYILQELIEKTHWRAEELVVWGKRYPQPRLVAWYGDSGRTYTYSGIAMQPLPWTHRLLELRSRVEEACAESFNSVLLNYYRNERDSIGMHSDDEPELGPRPTIASLSLGEQRVFTFKPRRNQTLRPVHLPLPSGSLLLMKGETQQNWKHGIAKATRPMGPRINLTFRQIGLTLGQSSKDLRPLISNVSPQARSMHNESSSDTLLKIWRQKEIPIILRRANPQPLLAKIPFAQNNFEWLRDDQRNKPEWDSQYKAWQIPQAWFERTIRLCLRRYSKCYVIQLHREQQVCAPACWNAQGADCECSCMGENHGTGHPGGRWYEIDETLAVSWGVQKYACRLFRTISSA